ncbi:unnamed protein product [Clonostachys rosea f. rosea IK726]|uniref:Uncharacterized protein n=1 Tax=Clonostachys rosea f. rosea IK726 TaxID=1349383 RepID=A0ACA9T6G3_BIOOC|nr:unnamed protein product [Clonostachys rosea f. rosea IK726]
MPVTIQPRPEKAGANDDGVVSSSSELLVVTSKEWTAKRPRLGRTNKRQTPEDRPVLRSSFEKLEAPSARIIPYRNGLVHGIIRAFEQDLHLVLRPDDVNAHAEELRHLFVTHKEKEVLELDTRPIPLREIDFQHASEEFIELLEPFLVDESLSEWLLPAFTTTTANDKTVAALTLMSTMKKYFDYTLLCGGCGFPSVTLEGEKKDWELLAAKVRNLADYGDEPADWSVCLVKVVEKMIESFDKLDDDNVKDFWMRACHAAGENGSGGTETLSGWLTAFCYWGDDGKRVCHWSDEGLEELMPKVDRLRLTLDGIPFPVISRGNVRKAVAEMPIVVKDYGTLMVHETTAITGQMAMKGVQMDDESRITHVQPMSGWWMLEDKTYPFTE